MGVRRTRAHRLHELGSRLVGEREKGRALVLEVQVEGADGDVGCARDVLRPGRVVAVGDEEAPGRIEELPSGLRLASLAAGGASRVSARLA